jgi:hypothetical protein
MCDYVNENMCHKFFFARKDSKSNRETNVEKVLRIPRRVWKTKTLAPGGS